MRDELTLSERAGQLGKWFAEYAEHHAVKNAAEKAQINLDRARYAYTLQDDIATLEATIKAQAAEIAGLQQYAATTLHDLSEAKAEINRLRDIVVNYGDRVRMATAHNMEAQQAIDRAFDRE